MTTALQKWKKIAETPISFSDKAVTGAERDIAVPNGLEVVPLQLITLKYRLVEGFGTELEGIGPVWTAQNGLFTRGAQEILPGIVNGELFRKINGLEYRKLAETPERRSWHSSGSEPVAAWINYDVDNMKLNVSADSGDQFEARVAFVKDADRVLDKTIRNAEMLLSVLENDPRVTHDLDALNKLIEAAELARRL